MADRCIRRHVDKQDGQVVIRRVTTSPVFATPTARQTAEAGRQTSEPGRAGRRITRRLRQAVSR